MKRLVLMLAIAVLVLAGKEARAWELDFPGAAAIAQGEFKNLSEELGSAIAYRNLAPAAPLGITGFDIALQASFINIKNDSAYWDKASNGVPSYVGFPSIRARKGLPFGVDVGAMYSYIVDSNVKLYGAEVSKALLEGSIATPALGVRGTYTKLAGVSDLDLQTAGIDASISKGFLFLTPYAGAGAVWIDSKPKGKLAALSSESMWQPRGFAGVKLSPLPLLGITAEVEYAARPIYSLKAGISF